MPLPRSGQEWPPKQLQPVNRKIAEWAAWFSGDPEQIANVYAAGLHRSFGVVQRIVRAVRRWFWGDDKASARNRVHYPLAGDIASASAALLFAEPPKFTSEHAPTQAALDVLVDDGLIATLLEGAEIAAALSGVWLRGVDGKLTVIHPDAAVGTWRHGDLTEVTLWREISSDGDTIVRHLEHHTVGAIEHGVYVGSVSDIGVRRPLSDYPETADLSETVETGLDEVAVAYVPNVKPNRIWRGIPEAQHLGVSDYSGLEGFLDQLDMAWTSWMRDVELGKARLIVPRQYLMSAGAGEGASFDLDREIYEPVSTLGGADGNLDIELVQPAIRGEEHARVVDALKRDITSSAGYSGRSFGLDSESQRETTATEVNSLDRKDLITRSRKLRYWAPALEQMIRVLLHPIDGTDPDTLVIEWPDGVQVDPEAEARTIQFLDAARAISTKEKVERLHPDWDKDLVTEEVERIHEEHGIGQVVDDPDGFTGTPGGEGSELSPTLEAEDVEEP